MPLNAKVDMSDGEQLALTGLLAVDEKPVVPGNTAVEYPLIGYLPPIGN